MAFVSLNGKNTVRCCITLSMNKGQINGDYHPFALYRLSEIVCIRGHHLLLQNDLIHIIYKNEETLNILG